jgi:hypothetical protein
LSTTKEEPLDADVDELLNSGGEIAAVGLCGKKLNTSRIQQDTSNWEHIFNSSGTTFRMQAYLVQIMKKPPIFDN